MHEVKVPTPNVSGHDIRAGEFIYIHQTIKFHLSLKRQFRGKKMFFILKNFNYRRSMKKILCAKSNQKT